MPSPQVDTHDRASLEASIQRWTDRLNRERGEIGRLRRKIVAIQARIQRSKRAIRKRRRQIERLPKTSVQRKVIEYAQSFVGQTENPPGSNTGHNIVDACQAEFGLHGVAWCGCFVGYCLRRAGGLVGIDGRIAYTPNIPVEGRNHTNGMAMVVDKANGVAGDLACFDWNHDGTIDHVALIVRNLGSGYYETVEGNTSFDTAGSQSNGGCVAERRRYVSDIGAIVRPAYA